MNRRDISIDATRGITALLVVFYHSSALLTDDARSVVEIAHRPGEVINWMAGAVRMALLMFVSGYLGRAALDDGAKSKLRAQQYFWIYFAWSAISLLLIGQVGGIPRQVIAPTTSLWYMWDLALAYATLPLVRRIPRPVVLCSLFALTMFIEVCCAREIGVLRNAGRFIIFFYIGLFHGDRIVAGIRRRRVALVVVGASVMLAAHRIDGLPGLVALRPLIVPERLACVVLALAAIFSLPAGASRPLAWLGRSALPIYLGHPILIAWASTAAGAANVALSPYLLVPIAVSGSIAMSWSAGRLGLGMLYRYPAGWSSRLRARLSTPERCSSPLM